MSEPYVSTLDPRAITAQTGAANALRSHRDVLLAEAAAIAEELRLAARTARQVYAKRPRATTTPFALIASLLRTFARSGTAVISFTLTAVLPGLAGVLYFSLVASDQYVTEARFAVRAGERAPLDALASLGMASIRQAQDSLIVIDYLKSRAMVEALDRRVQLRRMYSDGKIDWISRFNADQPIEMLVKYWRWKVNSTVENPSGIITLQVKAFTPDDSIAIARAVLAESEDLINNLSLRSRNDMLKEARKNLEGAEQRFRTVLGQLRSLRDRSGVIDPRKQAESVNKVIDELRQDRIAAEQQLSATRGVIDDRSPQNMLARARLRAIDEQIDILQRRLTAPDGENGKSITSLIVDFDTLDLDRRVAEGQYTAAMVAFERAATETGRQLTYVNTFVEPVRPEESLYPHRFWFSVASIITCLLVWMAGFGSYTLISQRIR